MKKTNVKIDTSLPQRLKNELANQPQQELLTRVKHFANLGDIVAVMAAVKKYWEVTGRKVIFSQVVNQLSQYYPGATHPTVNENGEMVCVNQKMFDMMKPLVESQPYIHKFEMYSGQKVDLDFDVIRGKTFVNMPNGMIQSWIMYAFPDLDYNLSTSWISLDNKCPAYISKQVNGKVILNFTERYRNHIIDYFFLKNYASDLIFAGTDKEHWQFCQKWHLDIPRLDVKNFLDYAYAIKSSRFILGNQSFGWNIAEAMKTPRILEVCNYAPNCMPFVGEYSYGYYHQVGAEYYFRKLHNITSK